METETGNDPKRPGVESARIFELTDVHAEEPDRPSHKARVQATLDMVPPGCGSVLEVGCGPGYLLRRVPAVRRFGTDPAVKNLKLVKDPVVVSSITHLPFSDDSVDLVLCAEVLEHLHPRDLEAAARELVRVARKHVLVTVPFQEDLLSGCTRCPSCNRVFHIHGHRTSWDEERLQSLFPSARRIEFKGVWRVRPFFFFLVAATTVAHRRLRPLEAHGVHGVPQVRQPPVLERGEDPGVQVVQRPQHARAPSGEPVELAHGQD